MEKHISFRNLQKNHAIDQAVYVTDQAIDYDIIYIFVGFKI